MGLHRWFLALCAAAPSALGDVTLDFELGTGGEKHQTRLHIAGDRVRFDAAQASTIVLPADKRTLMLFHGTRTYSELPHEDAFAGLLDLATDAAPPAAPPKITRTGKKEAIAGLECEQVIVEESGGLREELWLSPQAPPLALLGGRGNALDRLGMGFAESWKRWLRDAPALSTLPVRSIAFDPQGAELQRSTLTAFHTNAIAAETFQPPPGYAQADLPLFGNPPAKSGSGDIQSKTRELQDAVRRLGEELKMLEEQAR